MRWYSKIKSNSEIYTAIKNTSRFNLMSHKKSLKRKIMYIMRACPGAGKSTLAHKLGKGGVVYAGDDYFMVGNKYMFDENKLMDAHKWNLKRTEKAAKEGITPIVIDNTNLVPEDAQPYMKIGIKYGYEIEIAEPNTPWKFDADELAKRNRHGVTKESIERKLERYTPYTVEEALNAEPRKED